MKKTDRLMSVETIASCVDCGCIVVADGGNGERLLFDPDSAWHGAILSVVGPEAGLRQGFGLNEYHQHICPVAATIPYEPDGP